MSSLHTLNTWPVPNERPWLWGIALGAALLLLSMIRMAVWGIATLPLVGAGMALMLGSLLAFSYQEARRRASYRHYLAHRTHGELARTFLQQGLDPQTRHDLACALHRHELSRPAAA